MNRLALGTVQFGLPYGISNILGQVSRQEANIMLTTALAEGIDTLDTAIAYGDSEKCLGEIGVHGFKLITKLPTLSDGFLDIRDWVQSEIDMSLSRLCVTNIYGLLLHDSQQLLGPNGKVLYRALQKLKEMGQVQKIGVSIYSPADLDALIPLYRFDLVQSPFNLVDKRLYTSGWMNRLKESDVEIHTRSTFLQGLLLMAESDIPIKFLKWSFLWRRWNQWIFENNVTAVKACLAFTLSFPEIDRVVVGANSKKQLDEILSSAGGIFQNKFPEINCDDEYLINPTKWNLL